ncbi:hypothetical protein [Streptosporangium sp. NPDC002607]
MSTFLGQVLTLADLRAAVAKLADLPDDTRVLRAEDDGNDPDSYVHIGDLQITHWDGEVQCQEGDEDAKKALFVW